MTRHLPLAELRALFRQSPAFGRVYVADLVNQLGEGGLIVLFPLLLWQHTQDLRLAGLAFTGEVLAFGLLSPLAGLWADRWEQKALMQGSLLVRSGLIGALLLLLGLWPQAWWAALLLSFLLGACGAFFVPARAAFLRRLLAGEALERAVALEGTTHFLLRLVAPACYGALAALTSPSWGLALSMLSYLLAVALLLPAWVSGPWQGAAASTESPGAWKEGWRAIGASARLREVVLLDLLLSAVGMAGFSLMLPLLHELHLELSSNAWLLATTGVAGAVGTLLVARLPKGRSTYAWLTGLIALGYLLAPFAGGLLALMAAWALRGLAIGAAGVRFSQAVAREAPAEAMGRVQAAWGLAICLASTLGSGSSPFLIQHLGAGRAYLAFGALLGLVALAYGLALSAPWRRLRPAPSVAQA